MLLVTLSKFVTDIESRATCIRSTLAPAYLHAQRSPPTLDSPMYRSHSGAFRYRSAARSGLGEQFLIRLSGRRVGAMLDCSPRCVHGNRSLSLPSCSTLTLTLALCFHTSFVLIFLCYLALISLCLRLVYPLMCFFTHFQLTQLTLLILTVSFLLTTQLYTSNLLHTPNQ